MLPSIVLFAALILTAVFLLLGFSPHFTINSKKEISGPVIVLFWACFLWAYLFYLLH